MKSLSLILSGINSFRKNNHVIFSIYVFGYISMCFMFIFIYTNFMPSVVGNADNDLQTNIYNIDLQENTEDIEGLYDYLLSYNPYLISLKAHVPIEEVISDYKGEDIEITISTDANRNYSTSILGTAQQPGVVYDRIKNEEDIIVMYESVCGGRSSLAIRDEVLEVVPYYGGPDEGAYVSYDIFKKIAKADEIYYILDESLTIEEEEAFMEKVEEYFHAEVTHQRNELLERIKRMMQEFYQKNMLRVFSIVILAFTFLLKYMMDRTKRDYTIYRLTGASWDTVVSLILTQITAMNLMLILSSIAIYELLYDSFFEKINMYRDIHMQLGDYVLMTGTLILCSVVIAVPFIIRSISGSMRKSLDYVS